MLDEESRAKLGGTRSGAENVRLREKIARHAFVNRILQLTRPPHPFLFTAGRKNRRRFSEIVEQRAGAKAFTLDVGSGILGTENTAGLTPALVASIVAVEIAPTATSKIAADAHKLPFASESVDGLLIQGVLEHVEDPPRIAAEIYRVLKPGAPVYSEVPFIQHYHQDPEDYRRYTLTGLRQLFGQFEELDAGVSAGPSSALCDVLTEYAAVWFKSPILYWGVKWVVGWLVLPIRLLDYALAHRSRAHALAGALYYLGRRRQ